LALYAYEAKKGTGYTKKPIPYPKNKQADTFFRLLVFLIS
jgi:hypothetical protein